MTLDNNKMIELYKKMFITRKLELALDTEQKKGNIKGPIHLCVGQEAIGIGACSVLNTDDYVTSTHRGHAHYIGKGLDINKIVAEIMGKETGYCRGKAGHMLIADYNQGMLGGNGIVAGGLGISVGYGLSFKMDKNKRVSLSFIGDGATNEGMFHEALNMAAIYKTNNIFFVEHNMYGLTVRADKALSVEDISVRGASYNIPSVTINGNDILEVIKATQKAVERARNGEGPTLIEAKTYRILGFSSGDTGGYQTQEEIDYWSSDNNDPLKKYATFLEENNICTKTDREVIENESVKEVEEAIKFGIESPYPTQNILLENVFSN